MRVVMTTNIGGYRDGVPWPAPGDSIDVPDHEAVDLVVAGYARPADPDLAAAVTAGVLTPAAALTASQPPLDIAKANKKALLSYAADHDITVDPTDGVRSLRRTIKAALEGTPDASPATESDASTSDATGPGSGPDSGEEPAFDPARPVVDVDELDKGELLDLAAEANISVNPAWSTEEIRATLSGELGVTGDSDVAPGASVGDV